MELHVIEREGRKTVVLLDNEMRIVKPVYDYLKFQRQKDKALNTLKASGSDLRIYWEFLSDSGYEYDKVTPKMIAEFIDYLRASDDDVIALNKESKRTNRTINRILSTIHMFYSIEMTAHYLTLQEEEVKEIYSDMILSPESKIAGLRAKEIKGKLDDLFHGKTEDEIDDVIIGLAKTMSFNPLPTGVCLYDFRRGNCTDGDGCFFYNCPNYITEVQFYPILKDELDLLEKEMARLKELGHEREWQKQYIKYKYLKPLVESLEVQLNGKESVGQSGCRH